MKKYYCDKCGQEIQTTVPELLSAALHSFTSRWSPHATIHLCADCCFKEGLTGRNRPENLTNTD